MKQYYVITHNIIQNPQYNKHPEVLLMAIEIIYIKSNNKEMAIHIIPVSIIPTVKTTIKLTYNTVDRKYRVGPYSLSNNISTLIYGWVYYIHHMYRDKLWLFQHCFMF